jgi:hypothetical protein
VFIGDVGRACEVRLEIHTAGDSAVIMVRTNKKLVNPKPETLEQDVPRVVF